MRAEGRRTDTVQQGSLFWMISVVGFFDEREQLASEVSVARTKQNGLPFTLKGSDFCGERVVLVKTLELVGSKTTKR